MNELTGEIIEKYVKEYQKMIEGGSTEELSEEEVKNKFSSYFEKKAVLGFDIYRYSQYPTVKQTLIPYVFKKLYDLTITNCLIHEPFFFNNKTREDFVNHFIDSGDGGFQLFNNPFQAIVFSIYFQANVKRYNTGMSLITTQKITGEITLRYSLTYDNVYYYAKNYYGPAIINNARIMSKDALNRFLIDNNTILWFTQELNGIENLQIITFNNDFKNINMFKELFKNKPLPKPTVLFDDKGTKILKVDLLKIGEMRSKNDILSIHNLHIQILMTSRGANSFKKFTISLGNLNSSGITE